MTSSQEYNTKESVAALSDPEPEYAELVKANSVPKLPWHDVPTLRAISDAQSEQYYTLLTRPSVKDHSKQINLSDGHKSEIFIVQPTEAPSFPSPLIVLCFGGGFLCGSAKSTVPIGRALAALYGATVICAQYRLAPEVLFPTPQNDVWDTLKWAVANAEHIGADPVKGGFVLGGVSAGGNLAATLSQRWLSEKEEPKLTGTWLSIPLTMHARNPPEGYEHLFFSREQNKDADILTTEAIELIEQTLQVDIKSPLYSSFNVKENPHVGLPRTYIQVNGLDPLRDDGLIYEKVLRAHGVETRLNVYPGLPHGHWAFLPLPEKAMKVNVDIVEGFGWLLRKDAPAHEEIVKVFTPVTTAPTA